MRNVTVAATQMACTHNSEENIDKAVGLIKAAKQKIDGYTILFAPPVCTHLRAFPDDS